jgi:hypothetical protein
MARDVPGSGFLTQSLLFTEMHVGVHAKIQLLSNFHQNWNLMPNFTKTPQYQFHGNLTCHSQVVTCIQTDRTILIGTPQDSEHA